VAVSEAFKEQVRELLGGLGPLTIKPMFGGAGVSVDGAAFGLIFGETLYLKVDDETRSAFEAVGSEPFTYTMKDGRTGLLHYWSLPDEAADDADTALQWARLALEAAFRARKPKTKKGRAMREDIGPGPWDG